MDEKTINEYIEKLPQSVQSLLADSVWENRTIEIAKKYTLNQGQTESLTNITLLVLVGIEKPETFLDTIISDLSISRLLAEQIVEDLEKRVFEYALGEIEDKKPKIETVEKKPEVVQIKPQEQKVNNPQISTSEGEKDTELKRSNVPEIRPQNLPAKESPPKVDTTFKNSNNILDKKPEVQKNSNPSDTQNNKPKNIFGFEEKGSEVVEKPITIPKFDLNAKWLDNQKQNINPPIIPPIPQVLTNSTPNNVTVGKEEQPQKDPPNTLTNSESTTSSSKKYAVDPYREPLG